MTDRRLVRRRLVRIYITRNRRAPVIGLIGCEWLVNPRYAWTRAARAGVRIAIRQATEEEDRAAEDSPRLLLVRWLSIRSMLRYERDWFGDKWFRHLISQLREKRYTVAECVAAVRTKKRQHEAKLAARRRKFLPLPITETRG